MEKKSLKVTDKNTLDEYKSEKIWNTSERRARGEGVDTLKREREEGRKYGGEWRRHSEK